MLPKDAQVLATGSQAAERIIRWDLNEIRKFRPTAVANFAFLTSDRLDAVGAGVFEAQNRMLIDQFRQTIELPTVRRILTVSSGAVFTEPLGLYGLLKAEEEAVANGWTDSTHTSVVLRAYSMSGPHVRVPERYAFSEMILQAHQGLVRVRSDRLTYRRYTSVSDFLTVGMTMLSEGRTLTIESGGELVEMGDLAERVVARIDPSARIERPPLATLDASVYASDGRSWASACRLLAYNPMSLDEQIDVVGRSLKLAQ